VLECTIRCYRRKSGHRRQDHAQRHQRRRKANPYHGGCWTPKQAKLHPKKVGTLPVKGSDKEKQTNEIKTVIPLLDSIDIDGKTITADALLTQRKLARYLVEDRNAHYHFTAKNNQKKLFQELESFFENTRWNPNYTTHDKPVHGREETRKIWVTSELNEYLNFPYVAQAFKIERFRHNKKSGKKECVVAYGITSKSPELATSEQILKDNRQHWSIENSCHYILDWNYDEDRSRISKGYGPENMTRLRRFAIGLIKSKGASNVAQKIRQLCFSPRMVFDYLKIPAKMVHDFQEVAG
jgi:predicted transposase YbfD/YdcC